MGMHVWRALVHTCGIAHVSWRSLVVVFTRVRRHVGMFVGARTRRGRQQCYEERQLLLSHSPSLARYYSTIELDPSVRASGETTIWWRGQGLTT